MAFVAAFIPVIYARHHYNTSQASPATGGIPSGSTATMPRDPATQRNPRNGARHARRAARKTRKNQPPPPYSSIELEDQTPPPEFEEAGPSAPPPPPPPAQGAKIPKRIRHWFGLYILRWLWLVLSAATRRIDLCRRACAKNQPHERMVAPIDFDPAYWVTEARSAGIRALLPRQRERQGPRLCVR